jgi:hypothetical protein
VLKSTGFLRYVGVLCFTLGLTVAVISFYVKLTAPAYASFPAGVDSAAYISVGLLVCATTLLIVLSYFAKRKVGFVSTYAKENAPKLNTLSNYQLTQLDLYLLQSLKRRKKLKGLAKETGVDPKVISRKLDLLFTLGYLTENTELTEKGYDIVNSSLRDSTLTQNPLPEEQPIRLPAIITQRKQSKRLSRYVGLGFVVIIALLVFFLAPIVPYSTTTSAIVTNVNLNAQTSVSYAVFQCGIVLNPQLSGGSSDYYVQYAPFTGARWICGNSV